MKKNRIYLLSLTLIVLMIISSSCTHKYGCVITVKNIKSIESSHYTYDSTVLGKQFRFKIYIQRNICNAENTEQVLNEIFQKHAHENGFKTFEIINVYQTKVMDNLEYSVAFK